ncbi:MAG: DUF1294 domain-containing protein [Methanoregula sp.]|nr:DUF1294 domain-containing protein [Methanoregula sp.]
MYAILNGFVFVVYASDKRKARKKLWRTSENRLILLALIGPFGAFTAMDFFRHKTIKTKFLLVPAFLVLHIALIIWLLIFFMNL